LQKSFEDIDKQLSQAYLSKTHTLGIAPNNSDLLAQYSADKALIMDYADTMQEIDKAIAMIEKTPFSGTKSNTSSSTVSKYSPLPTQDALKQLLDTNKISLQQYYDGLLKIESEQYKGYRNKSYAELQSLLQSPNEATATKAKGFMSLYGEILNVGKTISDNSQTEKDNAYKKSIDDFYNSLEPFNKKISDINYQIERYNEILQQTPQEEQEQYLLKTNDLLEKEKTELHNLNEARRKQLPLLKDIPEEYKKLQDEIVATSLEWWKLDNQQKANTKTIKNWAESQKKANEELAKSRIDAQISIENELLDILKSKYQEDYENRKKVINDKYDLEIENLNRLKELMSRTQDEDKFKADQAKRYKELSDLQKTYNKVILDPTAKSERIDLEKQIADKTSEIKEAEIEHSMKLETDRIDDLIKLKQDAKERELQSEENKYNDFISNARNFNSQLQNIMVQGQQGILNYLVLNSTKYKEAGTTQAQAYIDAWKEQLNLAGDLLGGKVSGGSSGGSVQMWNPTTRQLATVSSNAVSKYEQQGWTTNVPSSAELSKMISDLGGTPSPSVKPTTIFDNKYSNKQLTKAEVEQLISSNDPNKLISMYGSLDEVKRRNPGIFDKYNYYKSLLPKFDFGGLAFGKGLMLKDTIDPERVLSPQLTKSFDRLVDLIPKIPLLNTNINPLNLGARNSSPAPVNFNGDIVVQVQKLENNTDFAELGNKVFNQLKNKLAWSGNIVLQPR
jgi:hypothetical protein